MTSPLPRDVAGLTLTPPRLVYEAADPAWGSASLERPHLARALDGATLTVRPTEGSVVATFAFAPFPTPAVDRYSPPPAVAWRALLVEHRLLARPELIWSGAFPAGWDAGLEASSAEEIVTALRAEHRRYRSRVEPSPYDYTLSKLECVECCAARTANLPPNLQPWELRSRMAPTGRCPHAPTATRAVEALCHAHPELTFELIGWIEPAGARAEAEGAAVTRFALTGPVMEAVLGPWLIAGERPLAQRTWFQGYDGSRLYPRSYSSWNRLPDPKRPMLPARQHGAVALAASVWGFTAEPEVLVEGDPTAEAPSLDRAAAPPIQTAPALPGDPAPKRARRSKRAP